MTRFFRTRIFISTLLVLAITCFALIKLFAFTNKNDDERFVTYISDPQKQHIELYWKDSSGTVFGSIQNLIKSLSAQRAPAKKRAAAFATAPHYPTPVHYLEKSLIILAV